MNNCIESTLKGVLKNEKGSLISGPFGSNISSKFFVEQGIPVIRGNNLSLGTEKFIDEGFVYVTEDKADELNCDAYRNDLIFTAAGTLGQVGIIPNNSKFQRYVISNKQIRARLDDTQIDLLYAYYWFSSPWIQKLLSNNNKGSTVPLLTLSEVRALPISYPESLVTQKRIADTLDDITKKIDNNNKINSKLESMAKTIYDYWFLQFEFPDEEGKPYKSSGGKMVWNEELKREIPEGWEVNNLAKAILKSKNGDWGNEEPVNKDDIKVNCFRGADFISITNDYHMTAPIRYIKQSNSNRLLENGDLVTEISGGSPAQATGRIGYINQGFLNRSDNVMDCSNFCKAFTPIDLIYQFWLYQTWKLYYDSGAMFNYESKTTGIKNLLFDDLIDSIFVAYPSEKLLRDYQDKCTILYEKIQKNLMENQKLASLRDFLLPLLMNGQVGFKD